MRRRGLATNAQRRHPHATRNHPPSDGFQLTRNEAAALRSQSAISSDGHGGCRYAPYVFTQQGVAMLSGVLRSKTAVAVNIAIMRTFVELRRAAVSYTAIERLRARRGPAAG
ncbi:MAG: ORF6N domain-containing protein [Solirubrobacteraceae bacterium]